MKNELTRNQSLVLNILMEAEGPLSAYVILDRLRDKGLKAPLQVYRALNKLIEKHHVHRLSSVNAFIACTKPDHCKVEASAFMICSQCSRVAEFNTEPLKERLLKIAEHESFYTTHTAIEIQGLCNTCKLATEKPKE